MRCCAVHLDDPEKKRGKGSPQEAPERCFSLTVVDTGGRPVFEAAVRAAQIGPDTDMAVRSGSETETAPFFAVWPKLLRALEDGDHEVPEGGLFTRGPFANGIFVALDPNRALDFLNGLVESSGYTPVPRESGADFGQLARFSFPRQSHGDPGVLPRAKRIGDDPRGADFSMRADGRASADGLPAPRALTLALSRILEKLRTLPEATLQAASLALPPGSAEQRLFESLARLRRADPAALRPEGRDRPAETHRVIGGIAFLPAPQSPEACGEEEGRDTGRDGRDPVPEREDLSDAGIRLLQTGLSNGAFPFESRPGQVQMLRRVARALERPGHLIAEAGTGTGKSLAYLVPSLLFARRTGEKSVIATRTVTLQEQLRSQDVALLQQALDRPASIAVLKGRNHYLCMRKLSEMLQKRSFSTAAERWTALVLASFAAETETGDREEAALRPEELTVWQSVASEKDSCIAKRCPFFRDCFYFRAKQSAQDAELIITNHALVLSDLKSESRVLPGYRRLVIDEAHHFEDEATRQFSVEVREFELLALQDRIAGPRSGLATDLRRTFAALPGAEGASAAAALERVQRSSEEAKTAAADLFGWVRTLAASLKEDGAERRLSREWTLTPEASPLIAAAEALDRARAKAEQARAELESLIALGDLDDAMFGRFGDLSAWMGEFCSSLRAAADIVSVRLDPEDFVCWVAGRGPYATLHAAPLSVSSLLRGELFSQKESVVLTSATMSVAGSFSYFRERLGLDGDLSGPVEEVRVESPFDYRSQALLCVPTDIPDVRDGERFTQAVAGSLDRILETAGGRTLVLFTSQKMLSDVFDLRAPEWESAGLSVLAQGVTDHRRSALVEAFRTRDRAVLFGVSSLWEGIDIRGEDLSCLVIVRLPFPVPTHPVFQARSESMRLSGKDPFAHYSVPQAAIRFTQGFGRLIRGREDRGAVFVLDRRLVQSRYGRIFLQSLPGPSFFSGPLREACAKAGEYFPRSPEPLPFEAAGVAGGVDPRVRRNTSL